MHHMLSPRWSITSVEPAPHAVVRLQAVVPQRPQKDTGGYCNTSQDYWNDFHVQIFALT